MLTARWMPARLTLATTLILFGAACADNIVDTGTTSGPLSLSVVSGDAQSALANTELPNALVVLVTDDKGHAARDQIVNFRVVAGGGSVYAGAALTNKDGIAQEWWTLGAAGAQTVEARAVDPTSGEKQLLATFHATITAPPPPPIPADGFEPNDIQIAARTLSNLTNGTLVGLLANFHTLTDVDWFHFRTIEEGGGCFPGSSQDLRVTMTLGNVPAGATYQVALFDGVTMVAVHSFTTGSAGFAYNYNGVCGSNDDKVFDIRISRLIGDATADLYSLGISYTEP